MIRRRRKTAALSQSDVALEKPLAKYRVVEGSPTFRQMSDSAYLPRVSEVGADYVRRVSL